MLYYLHMLAEWFSPLRVFQYITVRAIAAAGTSFMFSLAAGPLVIGALKAARRAEDRRYSEDAPALDALRDNRKRSTPSMGGVLILAAIACSALLWARLNSVSTWLALGTMLFMGAIGFADDFLKNAPGGRKGLSARQKLLLQSAWMLLAVTVMWFSPSTGRAARMLMVPFVKEPVLRDMGFVPALIFASLVVIGASNAVNLTDGLDGLAVGCLSAPVFSYLVMAYAAGHAVFASYLNIVFIPDGGELAVFCGAMMGACLGFLWFNCHPAEVFMGDTGSLALGGAVGMTAVLIKQELVLLVVGGVFVLEALSVIVQVASYRLTRRRIFACSPIHHHFELKRNPWSETQVTVRFWIFSIIFSLLGVLLLKIR